MKRRPFPSEYRAMWLFAMFDLPVTTSKERKSATRFRQDLLRDGFSMLQFSVYVRYCNSGDSEKAHRKHIRDLLPEKGQVRLISLTDRQFGLMEVFNGKKQGVIEKKPVQIMLF
jgi:CRISPR-associated protein Cas2